jgi:ATP-dependent exoDNAse (exonuclease V) alpha subunit
MEKFLVPIPKADTVTSLGTRMNDTKHTKKPSLCSQYSEYINRDCTIEPYLSKLGYNSDSGPMFNKLVLPSPTSKKDKKRMQYIAELKADYVDILKNCCYVLDKYDQWNPFISMELKELQSDRYYNLTSANTFEDAIYHLIEWFSTYYSKITLYSFSNIMKALKFNRNGDFIISNLFVNPFVFITLDHSYVKFQQAYHICEGLDIFVETNFLIEKWAIHTIQENSGSFYKNKRGHTQSWHNLLEQFCHNNNRSDHQELTKLLNKKLRRLESSQSSNPQNNNYTYDEYMVFEKNIGDTIMKCFYEESNTEEVDEPLFDRFIKEFETQENIVLEDLQVTSIKRAIENDMSIITGPPGTGKSTIVKAIVMWYSYKDNYNISIMAPTGKAFKGIYNKCKDYIPNSKICGTLHKCLLHAFPSMDKEHQKQIDSHLDPTIKQMDPIYPRNVDMIIIDESSMVDIFLFSKLINRLQKFTCCKLLLLGDVKQLPPVGKGRPFEDLINSEIFYTTFLTVIKRQDTGKLKDSIIAINKQEISEDDFDEINTVFMDHDFKDEDVTFRMCQDIIKLCEQDGISKDEICFISPEHERKGGTKELNQILQYIYNNDNHFEHNNFKHLDKVMRIENKYPTESINDDDDEKTDKDTVIRVNGDTGRVLFVRDNTASSQDSNYSGKKTKGKKSGYFRSKDATCYVEYDEDKYREKLTYKELYEEFTVNYCNTVHKWQGSQEKAVVFVVSGFHNSLRYQNALKLAYTAMSRATKKLIVVGDRKTFFKIQHIRQFKFISGFMKRFTDHEI